VSTPEAIRAAELEAEAATRRLHAAQATEAAARSELAGLMIDVYSESKGKPCPWRIAVSIVETLARITPEEAAKLLALADEA